MSTTATVKIVENVVVKKQPGRLCLGPQHLTWTALPPATTVLPAQAAPSLPNPSIRIPYARMKSQMINVPSTANPKYLLKLSVSSGDGEVNGDTSLTTHTFLFTSDTASADREMVKNALTSQISSVSTPLAEKSTALSMQEIKTRQNLLASNKELADLHVEYVVSGIISETDFWERRSDLLENYSWTMNQQKGVSSSEFPDLKGAFGASSSGSGIADHTMASLPSPATVGSDTKYTLTADMIHSIFIQSPFVHAAYMDQVPHKISETEFWAKYLSSKYFHRNRTSDTADVDQFFGYYINSSSSLLKDLTHHAGPFPPVRNKYLNIGATEMDHEIECSPDVTMKAGRVKDSIPVIDRFNKHSEGIVSAFSGHSVDKVPDSEILIVDLQSESKDQVLNLSIHNPGVYLSNNFKHCNSNGAAIKRRKIVNMSTFYRTASLFIPTRVADGFDGFNKLICSSKPAFESGSQTAVGQITKVRHSRTSELLRHFWAQQNSRPNSASAVVDTSARSLEKSSTIAAVLKSSVEEWSVKNSFEPLHKVDPLLTPRIASINFALKLKSDNPLV